MVLSEAFKAFINKHMSTDQFRDSINSVALGPMEQYLVRATSRPASPNSADSEYLVRVMSNVTSLLI